MVIVQPEKYSLLSTNERRKLREKYILAQNGWCMYCKHKLNRLPSKEVIDKYIDLSLFPEGFFNYPVHLQHNHDTDMTEGAVHSKCNAVMWQYDGR